MTFLACPECGWLASGGHRPGCSAPPLASLGRETDEPPTLASAFADRVLRGETEATFTEVALVHEIARLRARLSSLEAEPNDTMRLDWLLWEQAAHNEDRETGEQRVRMDWDSGWCKNPRDVIDAAIHELSSASPSAVSTTDATPSAPSERLAELEAENARTSGERP